MLAYGLPNSYLIGSATRSAPSALRRSANVRHLPATHPTGSNRATFRRHSVTPRMSATCPQHTQQDPTALRSVGTLSLRECPPLARNTHSRLPLPLPSALGLRSPDFVGLPTHCATRSQVGARSPTPLRYACLALPLLPTGYNVRSVSLCYALRAPIALSVLSSLPLDFIAITGVVCIGYRLFYLF